MATSGKQLSSLPQLTAMAGNNEILTWQGTNAAQRISRDDFIASLPTHRQPSTTYAVGNIKYHATLPTGWYLECTTAGTTDAGALVITSPSIGGTVSDGTVVWTLNKNYPVSGGALTGRVICRSVNDSGVYIVGGNNDTAGVAISGAQLALMGMDRTTNPGDFFLQAYDKATNTIRQLHGEPDGKLSWLGNDLAGSAIVAKSLGHNGYIKYASGLIIQFGYVTWTAGATSKNVTLPIAFSDSFYHVFVTPNTADINANTFITATNNSASEFKLIMSNIPTTFQSTQWFAIGY